VQLFFVASALTLCMSWDARAASEQAPIGNFYLRRLFRILPMFQIAVALYVLLDGLGPRYWAPDGVRWWYVALTALCLHGFFPETINSVVPGGWSVADEMTFYLLLPVLLRVVPSLAARVWMWLVSLVATTLLALALTATVLPYYPRERQYLFLNFLNLNFVGQFPVFAVGLVAYALYLRPGALTGVIGALGTVSYLLARAVAPSDSRLSLLLDMPPIAAIAFACFALLLARWPTRVLTHPAVVRLGRLSYSIYLVHFALLELLTFLGAARWRGSDLASVAFLALVLTLSALLSRVTYALIERPGIALGARVIERLERGRARARLVEAGVRT
jgi:peptidoglycan/LPS O-acetylase OafA/YrhL